jgi:hypothetical protein
VHQDPKLLMGFSIYVFEQLKQAEKAFMAKGHGAGELILGTLVYPVPIEIIIQRCSKIRRR